MANGVSVYINITSGMQMTCEHFSSGDVNITSSMQMTSEHYIWAFGKVTLTRDAHQGFHSEVKVGLLTSAMV